MLSIYLYPSTCKYLSLDNGVTMTSKRRWNIFFGIIYVPIHDLPTNFPFRWTRKRGLWGQDFLSRSVPRSDSRSSLQRSSQLPRSSSQRSSQLPRSWVADYYQRNRMFAAKFSIKRLPFTCVDLICPISSFVQARSQRAQEAQSKLASEIPSEILEDEPLPFDQIPGPQGRYAPAVEFYRQSDGFEKFYKIPEKLFKDYGPIFKQYVTDKTPVIHVMEPTDFEAVFRAEGKYPSRPPLECLTKHYKRKAQPDNMFNL